MLINDINSGIECTLSKSADDTKLCGAVSVPEGQDAIQRDLHRLEQCAQENLLRLSKVKCKVLHMACVNSHYQYKVDKMIEHMQKDCKMIEPCKKNAWASDELRSLPGC